MACSAQVRKDRLVCAVVPHLCEVTDEGLLAKVAEERLVDGEGLGVVKHVLAALCVPGAHGLDAVWCWGGGAQARLEGLAGSPDVEAQACGARGEGLTEQALGDSLQDTHCTQALVSACRLQLHTGS